ncbi:MAG: hypothetical protein JWR67_2371 [Mucilaginibacter sp.]|nr:hypothetical protein [Mucilaginibacter sp.]
MSYINNEIGIAHNQDQLFINSNVPTEDEPENSDLVDEEDFDELVENENDLNEIRVNDDLQEPDPEEHNLIDNNKAEDDNIQDEPE